jgi:uncharacterized membrane protein YraQ (UPF0718 family)
MIPIFGGIMAAGAGLGPASTFLLMVPAANFLAILFTSEFILPLLAAARFVFSFVIAILLGFVVVRTPWERPWRRSLPGSPPQKRSQHLEGPLVVPHPWG